MRSLITAALALLMLAPAARAADGDPQMQFDDRMKVERVCFTANNPGDPVSSQIYGQRYTDGPVGPQTPAIVLAHGIASSVENWDFSPTWSVARALASAGYVVYAYDRLGYARSVYDRPGGGFALQGDGQRDVLHQVVGQVKNGAFSTTTAKDCAGDKQPNTMRNPTVAIMGHSYGGSLVAGYPGKYHDVAAMIQTSIVGSAAGSETTPPQRTSRRGGRPTARAAAPQPSEEKPDYIEFFQNRQECLDFNVFDPGAVKYAVETACDPAGFVLSPSGEVSGIAKLGAENEQYIREIGPSTPVLLISGDHDGTAPPEDAKKDFAFYKANCGCDVEQFIPADTAHLFMVHKTLPQVIDRVVGFLSARGIVPTVTPRQAGVPAASAPAQRRSPRGLTARATPGRDRRAPFRFGVRGQVLLFSGMDPAQWCRGGRVSVQTKAGRKTVSTRRVRLRPDCSYSVRVAFSRRTRLGRSGRLRVTARFLGNDALRGRSTRARVVRAG